jgi:glycosyltransferase involved in cell wall biosynthesis
MPKKKILIFIDWYLPGYKAGGPIQSISNLVDHLKDEFDFSIITRDTDYCETTSYPNVKSNEWNILSNGVSVYYFSSDQLNRNNLRNLIRKTNFDYVYLNGIYSLYFTLIPLFYLRKKHKKNIVIATRGMLAKSALGVKKEKKNFFIRTVKILRLFDNVVFHATNEIEKLDIQREINKDAIVKKAANLPQKLENNSFSQREKLTGFLHLVNVARISPEKNLLFALQILKQVKSSIVFDFYGPVYNQEYWIQCKLALDELPQNIRANYKGSIKSEKVHETLKQYHFMFMPTSGENFGHIILQSFSASCPVIISTETPWKQLHEKNVGWDIPLDHINKFAHVIDLCAEMDQLEYDRMSKAAFTFANEYINDPKIINQNRNLFLQV